MLSYIVLSGTTNPWKPGSHDTDKLAAMHGHALGAFLDNQQPMRASLQWTTVRAKAFRLPLFGFVATAALFTDTEQSAFFIFHRRYLSMGPASAVSMVR